MVDQVRIPLQGSNLSRWFGSNGQDERGEALVARHAWWRQAHRRMADRALQLIDAHHEQTRSNRATW
jgi:hypothetical protein